MTTEVKAYRQPHSVRPELMVHNTEHLTPEGEFMLKLVERWGMAMSVDDGEDSSGRHKTRLMLESELVDRAAEMTELAFDVVRDSGWTITVPTIDEMDAVEAT